MKKAKNILNAIFPYLAVLFLWRLSVSFWNPGGILAIIPIFYFSFIKPREWFGIFAFVFCFLIDYNFDSLLFWTTMYCLFYAINGFQNFVDLTRQKNDGILIFMSFFGFCAIVLSLFGFTVTGFLRALWLVLWTSILYISFAALAKRICND